MSMKRSDGITATHLLLRMSGTLLSVTALLLTACSDQRPVGPTVHPLSWMVRSSPDFHGRRVAAEGIDFCQSCHAEDLHGGNRATSCYACHALGGTCSGCHGTAMWHYAPPPDLEGDVLPSAIGVGAHLFHVIPSTLADGYDCTVCHIKPTELASPGHMDTGVPAEVTFGDLALNDGANPAWDRSSASCAGVYCHGATLEGGTVALSQWTNPEDDACGKCHPIEGMIQGSHHVHLSLGFDCAFCHEGYGSDPERVVTSSHVDGTVNVDLSRPAGGAFNGESCSGVRCHGAGHTTPAWGETTDLGCTGCHGGAPLPSDTLSYSQDVQIAPPTALSGSSETTDTGVGAHRSHVVESVFRVPMECSECHMRPQEIEDEGHIGSDLIAEITFGDLAKAEGAAPVWNRDTATCSGTYCHGATIEGGTHTEPVWTIVNPPDPADAQVYCGSCHGIPPHDQFGPCNICHGNVVSADTTITDLGKTLHINGQIDF